jgi:hypothetical protein
MEAMSPDYSQKIDLNTLTVQDIDRLLEENADQRRRLLDARKHLVVIEKAKVAAASSLTSAMGGNVIQFPASRPTKSDGAAHRTVAPTSAFMPRPGSLEERIFENLLELPLTSDDLATKLGENPTSLTKRLHELEGEMLMGHFDIERRKPTKHKGVSTPVTDRYYYWRPRAELEPRFRRAIFTGLLMRKWWTNAELVDAAKAKTFPEIRTVDNMVRTLRRSENVWHQMGEGGRWMYWIREDRAEPPKEMDGRDWGPKSKHARHQQQKGKQPRKASSAED